METVIGIAVWVAIFVVWYVRTYPEKLRHLNLGRIIRRKRPKRKSNLGILRRPRSGPGKDYKSLVQTVESISGRNPMGSSDAAAMVQAVKDLLEIEPASGQMWEALALDAMEHSEIICDDCRVPVRKTVKKTGIKIECDRCHKWLALKNSKVTVIDPKRPDVEEWEH